MYEETDSFYPCNSIVEEHGLPYTFEEENIINNNHRLSSQDLSSAAMEIQLQNHLDMAAFNSHLLPDSSSNHLLPFNSSDPNSYSPDFLTLYHLSKCSSSSFLPNPSISLPSDLHMTTADTASASSMICDPILYLNNLPPQPPLIRDLFQSLPGNGYSRFGGDDLIEANDGGLYQDCDGGEQQIDDGVMEFNFNMGCLGKRIRKPTTGKVTKQFVNERQRRVRDKDTYQTLRDLVPNPTKKDRASIVADAIGYIKELMITVNDLKMLVEKKRSRSGKNRHKRLKNEEEEEEQEQEESTENGHESSCLNGEHPPDQTSFNNGNGSLRSSWLQRKSKDTEVDVRIIDDEVTVKLVQRKRMNRLLYVSKVLDELHLDLHHVAGGHVGDYYSFLFNTKINEGSCVYASAIANRIMEVVEGPNITSTPSTGCF